MVVSEESINNIMSGIENTGGVKQNNHKKKLRQRFTIIKKLGQGTFGKVQLGINKETGQEVAIKTIKKSKIETEADLVRIQREIQIMSSVQHPNIIHIYEVFENKEKMVLVMEYAAGGELYDYLSARKVLTEVEARRIFRQIATACFYCHKHKICHRDLKLENILLDENNNAKIADFGLSNVFDDQRLLNTFCGSPLYASPEIVKGTPYQGPEVDCWSLGVLLYTLVYGAMPFDGSNFKRLVKQISQGDYFEPENPSPASPLIREMLTVNPKSRADIEKICSHWWVNETYDNSCLEISEELASQTPVRLDLLLSLAPPPPQLESDKLVCEEAVKEASTPARSHSVGSIMDLNPAERRIIEMIQEDKATPKRKLATAASTAQIDKGRREKIVKENTVADITLHGIREDSSMSEAPPIDRSLTQTLSREMDVEQTEEIIDPSLQGAACAEIIEEAEKKEVKKPLKIKKTMSTTVNDKIMEEVIETPQKKENKVVDKENVKEDVEVKEKPVREEEKVEVKPTKRKVEKKVLTDKDENSKSQTSESQISEPKKPVKPKEKPSSTSETESKSEDTPSKPVERRKSRIFEAAEKFQNLISPTETKPIPIEKPKKILIPGVSVDGFKKEYERRTSLTSTSPPKVKSEAPVKKIIDVEPKPEPKKQEERKEAVRNAVNIISSALDKEGTRKSKSRPCMMRKPPVPFGVSGRSASGNIGTITSQLQQPLGPKPFVKTEPRKVPETPEPQEDKNQVSSAEITLKSATLPRRKTAKAEIKLNYPTPKPATMEFKTEMAHNVAAAPRRSEMVSPPLVGFRADSEARQSKERIIPIAFEKNAEKEAVQSPPTKPPTSRLFQTQKSTQSQRSGSLSRQSTQDSDTDTIASNGEPIKKSPREYIIPIAVEGGGYVTPRAGSLEPSETGSTATSKSRFGRTAKRLNSRLSDRDSEDESPFTNLHRHSSFGKDSDNEDSRSAFHMHRLRSSRPKKSTLEHNDSLSSGEEDDDEGFENFTAENLFSTLLSRVRDLTQRLNVEDGSRPGFPTSRLLSQFNHGTNFFNRQDPFTRHSSFNRTLSREGSGADNNSTSSFTSPWRRSVSRDLASDIDSVIGDSNASVGSLARPRGDATMKNENLNLSDLDLKKLKLSEEDALALSYLTPGLSKRIQKQLLAQLAPSEAKKLHRTLSSRGPNDNNNPYENVRDSQRFIRRSSADRLSSTLPRRYSVDKDMKNGSLAEIHEKPDEIPDSSSSRSRSFLPIKSFYRDRTPYHDFNVRSSSIGAEPKGDSKFMYRKPTYVRSTSVNPRFSYGYKPETPDSSISESVESSSYKNTDSISELSSAPSKSYSRYSEPYFNTAKTEIKKPSTRKVSRFLRPDFYDTQSQTQNNENFTIKAKSEKELETQKVLKEIRDKRKSRLTARRERSQSKEKEDIHAEVNKFLEAKNEIKETKELLNNVSDNIKNLESTVNNNINGDIAHIYNNLPAPNNINVNGINHDYVNMTTTTPTTNTNNNDIVNAAENTEAQPIHDYVNVKAPEVVKKETKSKIARPKSYPAEKDKEITPEKESKISRLKKGLTRQSSKEKELKEDNKKPKDEEKGSKNKLLQSIEKKLEKFRSSNIAATKDPEEVKVLQEKKSSVESAIKRLREQSLPRNIEHCTESGLIKRAVSVEEMPNNNNKPLQASRKSVTKILGLFKKYEEQDSKKKVVKKEKEKSKKVESNEDRTVINNNSNNDVVNLNASESNNNTNSSQSENSVNNNTEKKERPRSLMFDRVRHYNGSRSDSVNLNDKDVKGKSKLPVNNINRRSLNLDNLPEPPKFYKNPTEYKPDRNKLRLDLSSKSAAALESYPSTSSTETYRDSSAFLSPNDDASDSWSVCSDYHPPDFHSPLSPNGHMYSGDENESVIDRIRRKSFYTRFNENKRIRKPSLTRNYNDLDLNLKSPTDYSSLDRRSLRNPVTRRSTSYVSSLQPPQMTYQRSSSLLNDYVNVPNRYQTYNSKIARPATALYADQDDSTLDDYLTTAKSRKFSSPLQPSRLSRTSVSPSQRYTTPVDRNRSSMTSPNKSDLV
ncbi:unnamed protein product [Brassicogethes aeneus]|uniref:Protein kinase domain-containing protein n=1 Tax=Brassicogethes aeneus TaxID=1431903 RepID=A0A9P0FG90_BRAAE|nr:unnamed protein product [Brassicogethes aeneus]